MIRTIAIFVTLAAFCFVLILIFNKSQKPWNYLTEEEKRKKKILLVSGSTVFLAGLITSLLMRKKK
jgi:hypothetical protein